MSHIDEAKLTHDCERILNAREAKFWGSTANDCAALIITIFIAIGLMTGVEVSLMAFAKVMSVGLAIAAPLVLCSGPMRYRYAYGILWLRLVAHRRRCRLFNRRLTALQEYDMTQERSQIPESMLEGFAAECDVLRQHSLRLSEAVAARNNDIAFRKAERRLNRQDRRLLRTHHAQQLRLEAIRKREERFAEAGVELRQLADTADRVEQSTRDVIGEALRGGTDADNR